VRAARRHWTGGANGGAIGGGTAAGPGTGGELLVAAAGRIEWEKGFSTLVRAMPGLREAGGDVHVVLAGRGSEVPRLTALAAELGVADALHLPGWLTRRDLAALYAAADAVVVPSRYEPSGLVVREAQAAGASVVASRVGGIPETVTHGETGLLMDVGDVHGLRDAVLRLAADPAGARAMGRAAAAAVRGRTWADAATATGEVYRLAAARHAEAGPAPHLVG
jgi:glycogen(starch) synthase